MRILHVCDSIIGGTGSYLAELLTLQAQRRGPGKVMLLMPYEHREHVEPRLADSGVEFRYFSRKSRVRGMVRLALAFLSVRREFRPDIVHGHTFGAGVVTRVLRFGRRPATIFCPHGWAFDIEMPALARNALIAIERLLALRSEKIVLISEHEERRARAIGIAERRLALVPNGIAAAPPAIPAVPWADNRLKLLFVGRFDRQKGLDLLIEAIRPLADRVALRIVGAPAVSSGYHPPPSPMSTFAAGATATAWSRR
ncbi:glycosyltransferase [Sphingomonas hankookensis]|uniref:glycosyltransferase n=1 Tax=Sphingomonas hankookensis TaxID=563996 RepID=UPI003F7AFC0C